MADQYKSIHTGTQIDSAVLKVNSGAIVGTQGPQGPQGNTGAQGPQGPAGPGVPTGGSAGQLLVKNSSVNYDTVWVSPGTIEELRGPQGPQGAQGERGLQGIQGEKGEKGDKGDPGDSADIDTSNLIILEGGATVTIDPSFGDPPYTVEIDSIESESVTLEQIEQLQNQIQSVEDQLQDKADVSVLSDKLDKADAGYFMYNAEKINTLIVCTQDEYDALTPDSKTVYFIKE